MKTKVTLIIESKELTKQQIEAGLENCDCCYFNNICPAVIKDFTREMKKELECQDRIYWKLKEVK